MAYAVCYPINMFIQKKYRARCSYANCNLLFIYFILFIYYLIIIHLFITIVNLLFDYYLFIHPYLFLIFFIIQVLRSLDMLTLARFII